MATNRLDRRQARAVEDWLAENWADIERRRLTKDDAAAQAALALQFRVTRSNIESAAATLEKQWPSTPTAKQKNAWRLRLLVEAVAAMYAQNGYTPPSEPVARLLGLPWPATPATDDEAEAPACGKDASVGS